MKGSYELGRVTKFQVNEKKKRKRKSKNENKKKILKNTI